MVTVQMDKDLLPLWQKFHSLVAEMIIVKEKGRKLFPRLEYVVRGLQPDAHYIAILTFKRVDDYRYKYSCGEWQTNGKGEAELPPQPQFHTDGVVTGRQMMSKKLSFDYLRFTNNIQNRHMVILQSMHKFRAVLEIWQSFEPYPGTFTQDQLAHCRPVAVYEPEFLQFIAVTAYFNDKIRNLKIEENKYAKGHKNDRYSDSKYSPRPMKMPETPVDSPSSTYTTPNTSPASDSSWPMMKGLQYPIPTTPLQGPMMWQNDQFYNFNLFPYQTQFPDAFAGVYNPYNFFPMNTALPPYDQPTPPQ